MRSSCILPSASCSHAGRHSPLAFSLRRLAGALDLLPLPALVLSDDGSAVAVNTQWTRLSGMAGEASWGEGWLGALYPLDRATLRRRLAGAAVTGEPGSGDFWLTGPDGGQRCRWWWRPGAPSQLVVCLAGLDQRVTADAEGQPEERLGREGCP